MIRRPQRSTRTDTRLPYTALFRCSFCLRAVGDAAAHAAEPGYPLSPNFVVHVGYEGEVLLPYTQAKQVLDRLKKTAIGRDFPDAEACARFDKDTRLGRDMGSYQSLLARAVASIAGTSEARAIAGLFRSEERRVGKECVDTCKSR